MVGPVHVFALRVRKRCVSRRGRGHVRTDPPPCEIRHFTPGRPIYIQGRPGTLSHAPSPPCKTHTLHTWQRTASSRPTALDRCSAEPTSGKLSPPAPPAQCNQLTTHGRRISVHCSRGICGLGCTVACLLPASYSLTASSNSPESSASDTPITRTPSCETRHTCTVNISQGGTCTEHTRPSL